MSHIVQIQAQVRDALAARAGARRLGLPESINETVKLFSSTANGLAVRIKDWRYLVVFDLKPVLPNSITTTATGGSGADLMNFFRFMPSKRPRLKLVAKVTR